MTDAHAAAFDPILQRHADWLDGDLTHRVFECEPGWAGLLSDLFDAVGPGVRRDSGQVRIGQIKEKYGALSVSWVCLVEPSTQRRIDALVELAELRSTIECEACGRPARLRGRGWVQTLCDTHARERGRE